MATIMYTLLATSTEPSFDLASIELAGGENLLVVQAVAEDGEVSEYSDAAAYYQEYSEYVIKKDTLTAIADSVRGKTGKTDPILTEEIPTEIESILVPSGTVPIEFNGTHDVTAYASAKVDVHPTLQEKRATENGNVTPDEGYDGLSNVIVDVDASTSLPSEYDGGVESPVQIRYPYEYRFYEAPDVSIDMSNNGMLFFDGALEWDAIRVDATNKAIYFINTTNNTMRTIYTAADGWDATDAMARYFSVSSFGADYYPDKYTFRGWFASNTHRILPEYRFSYDGSDYRTYAGYSVTIPCEGKVMKTDIVIYDATTNEE